MAVAHEGVSCDVCGESPLRGVRYRCAMCSNFDLCDRCINGSVVAEAHDDSHLFLRIARPNSQISSYPIVVNRSGLQHVGIRCACCQVEGFTGFRYICQVCPDTDLCEACEFKGSHDPSHTRLKIGAEDPVGVAASSRATTAPPVQGAGLHAPPSVPQTAGLPLCSDCKGRPQPNSSFASEMDTDGGFGFSALAFGSAGEASTAVDKSGDAFGRGPAASSLCHRQTTQLDACACCLCPMTATEERQVLPCGHTFHRKCAAARLRQFNACPLPSCRLPVTSCIFCGAPLQAAASGGRKAVAFDIGEWSALSMDTCGAQLLALVHPRLQEPMSSGKEARRVPTECVTSIARADASWAAVAPFQVMAMIMLHGGVAIVASTGRSSLLQSPF